MAGDRGQRRPDFANERLRRFVDADDGGSGARPRRVEAEHVLHARDVRGVDLRDRPHLFLPRFQGVLRQAPANRRARNARLRREPDDFRRKQRQRPSRPPRRRLRTRRRDQEGLFRRDQFPFRAGPRALREGAFQSTLDEVLFGPIDGRADPSYFPISATAE
jgi:hypothetical protein